MSDDGTGTGIMIPSIIINKEDGDKLKNYLLNNLDEARNASIIAVFEQP